MEKEERNTYFLMIYISYIGLVSESETAFQLNFIRGIPFGRIPKALEEELFSKTAGVME